MSATIRASISATKTRVACGDYSKVILSKGHTGRLIDFPDIVDRTDVAFLIWVDNQIELQHQTRI
jgi:hypothetical protein